MKIRDVVEAGLCEVKNEKDLNIEITSVSYNSIKCERNSAFFAIKGFETDGHKYIDSAIKNGAVIIFYTDDNIDFKEEIVYVKCKDIRRTLAYVSSLLYDKPSEKINLVGITGTNGKTSFCEIIKHIFDYNGKMSGYIGTLGVKIGSNLIEGERTTPESLELNTLFKIMSDRNLNYCFMEVSSQALDLHRADYVDFNVGVFSNLTQDHLDYHKTFENYYLAKRKLFDMVKNYSIINIDDEYGKRLYDELKSENKRVVSFGKEKEADFRIENEIFDIKGSEFNLINEEHGNMRFFINLIGEFNIYNSVPAIIYALNEGISYNDINNALVSFGGVNGRLERVLTDLNYNIFVDYAHTPDGMEKVLLSVGKLKGNSNIVSVFGCGGNRDKTKRPIMGRIAEEYSDSVIITDDNPREEKSEDIIKDILEGIKNKEKIKVIADRKEAIIAGIDCLNAGDILVILGKGHENYQIVGKKKFHFSDYEIVKEYIAGKNKIIEK